MAGAMINHQTFGEMEQDGSDLQGMIPVGQHEDVSILVSYSDTAGVAALDDAAKLLARIDPDALIARAVEDYLDNYNSNWSQEDDDIDAAEFRSRLTLSALIFTDDQTASATVECGNMFQGHSIRIDIHKDGTPKATSLQG
jgi:hypothetical protein